MAGVCSDAPRTGVRRALGYHRPVASEDTRNGKSAEDGTRRRRMTALQRREEILAAATDVFAEQGFQSTAIDKVAQRAGVSKALIYEHFASKSELQEAVLRELTSALVAEIVTSVQAATTAETVDSQDRLRAGIDAYFKFLESHRGAWHMLFRESVGREASQVVLAMEPAVVAAIVDVLSEAPETIPLLGEVEAGVRLRVAAQMLTGAMQWAGNWWVDNMELVPRERIVDWAMGALWLGLDGWTRQLREQMESGGPAAAASSE